MPRATDATVDEVDRRLIDLLRDDARASVNDLATQANVSRANAYQRLARLRESGAIRRFTVDVDHRQLGDTITALVFVDIDQHAWREMGARLLELPGVDYVGFTTGTMDIVLIVRAPDMQHLRDVVLERLQSFPEVRSTQTSFVLEELRR
ncbi:MAG: Lrp/AsnC family transcriptional regulator [Actinobacteria bacterium]|nr:Lrp/AsnC family transcriptional regulator [Actinomycetota bacterium]MBV9666406.1 Lrp/AsnC family transcriptional regulator [Actinomycetota bacterium]